MPITPRPITGKPRAAAVKAPRTSASHPYQASNQEMPPHPKPKLTEPEIATLYNGCHYSNVVVPREPFWRWLPPAAEPWSLTSLRGKLMKIGAKIVSDGRYVTFQMAEIAIPRHQFADILRLVARLRAPPAPARGVRA